MTTLRTLAALLGTAALTLTALGGTTAPAAAAPGDEVADWVEVENGVISGGPTFNSGDHGNFSGTGSYTFRETGMTSTMTVTVPEAGTYPIYIRYAAGPLSAGENVTRSMGLVTNGDRQQVSFPMTSFDDWETWRFATAQVTLDAGANTVALQCDRAVDFCRLNFDAIQVGGPAADPCTALPAEPGWTSLYDGTFASFDGWRKAGAGGFGRQEDCSIQTVRGRGATWHTQQQTAPYTLQVEWRQVAANDDSSVHVASTSRSGADPVGGYSIRIGESVGGITPAGGQTRPADAAAVAAALRPAGQWNTFTIRVSSDRVQVHLNGTLVNDLTTTTAVPTNGFVGLENRSVTDNVDFRAVRIKAGVAPDQVDSTTTAVTAPESLSAGSGTTTLTATVAADGATPTGEVAFYLDGELLATGPLVDGEATATAGPFTDPGEISVEARYAGSETVRPSTSATTTLTVVKARPRVRATVQPGRILAGRTRATVKVAVSAAGLTPSGKVTVRVAGRTHSATVRDGVATLRLPVFKRPGGYRAAITYAGNARIERATASTTLRVVRPPRR